MGLKIGVFEKQGDGLYHEHELKEQFSIGLSPHLIVTNLSTTPTALLFDWRTMHPSFGVTYLCHVSSIK